MELVNHTVINLIIFVLAIYVGYHVVWTVTPALHTPLMAVTNAISAIIIVGAMLAAGLTQTGLGRTMGVVAVALAAVNVFGGFLVTQRAGDVQEERAEGQGRREWHKRGDQVMSMNLVTLLYLLASVCFIQALKGLSHPTTARRGNAFGMTGMAIAAVTTLALIYKLKSEMFAGTESGTSTGFILIFTGLVVGGGIGAYVARTVEMTKMPELVAAMHSLIGLAAVCIAVAAVAEPDAFGITMAGDNVLPLGNRVELFIGTFVGAITFSGSVIAFGKLSGKYKFRLFQGAPVQFAGQHMLNLLLAVAMLGFGILFFLTQSWLPFVIMTAIAFVLGVLIIIPIGGADMPVVVSMLNSYSGWAAAGIGFSLNNPMLIIAGSLVGSSGAILSYIMCRAMNRSFFNVILGGFGSEASAGAAAGGGGQQRPVKSGSPDDAAFLMGNAETVIIVPGYGLAVARAQHALKELTEKLSDKGVTVKYAIHPVAGRMPGHMNVLLAEAEVPYDQVFEMEDINGEFGQADVVLVLGANDVVNPAAKNDPKSPIAGMPILEAYKAKTIIVNKRSMNAGYAGLDNELFYMDKTMMVFGDAKKVVEDMVKSVD
ncbi:NAD(P)(+) transhydrogenase (Re/Si-specific) subunit beta [Ralstonia insidiosa]|nr:NAD(P)(+) transhydrogenase (Re/Si-specific) subunit beta [Ralstonia insidiosa]